VGATWAAKAVQVQIHGVKELERFFYKGHWCYVGLEAEVPEPGRLQAHGGRRALGDPGA
jgi:phenylpropionate dioxygenase-like ring-hydroxylating dioxygenase large terminal subunit